MFRALFGAVVTVAMLAACESPPREGRYPSTPAPSHRTASVTASGASECPEPTPLLVQGDAGLERYTPLGLVSCEVSSEYYGQTFDLDSLVLYGMIEGAREQVGGEKTCHAVYLGCLHPEAEVMRVASKYTSATLHIGPGMCPGSQEKPDPCMGPVYFFDFGPQTP